MHWLLLVGGEAGRASGKIVHRACFQHCSPQQLGNTINESMLNLYRVPNGVDTPAPHQCTWVLGFQVQDHGIIEEKELPDMMYRMERLNVCAYQNFFEDEPEGSVNCGLLSLEKCRAWLEFIADKMLDSKVVKEIVLYEFSDRPEEFPKPIVPEVSEPWKCTTVAMFSNKTCSKVPPNLERPTSKAPPAYPENALRPGERQNALATEDGGGPERPSHPLEAEESPDTSFITAKGLKIAGIKAALEYNGYPPHVVKELIENSLELFKHSQGNYFTWILELSNGKIVTSYGGIDANAYPGGKITQKSARKCHKSQDCPKQFGHAGSCSLNDTGESKTPVKYSRITREMPKSVAPQNPFVAAVAADVGGAGNSLPYTRSNAIAPEIGAGPSKSYHPFNRKNEPDSSLETKKKLKIAVIRAALQYNGYPSDVIEELLQNRLRIELNTNLTSLNWGFKLPSGKYVQTYGDIDKNPYPGGKITEASARKCHIGHCILPFAHRGQCWIDDLGNSAISEDGAGPSRPSLATEKEHNFSTAAGVNNSRGPSKRNNTQNVLSSALSEAISHHATAGVRTALNYAGYPLNMIDKMMQNDYGIVLKPLGKGKKCHWSLSLPNGERVNNISEILKNPFPGGIEIANQVCYTLGCDKVIGHQGSCSVLYTERYQVKREADFDPVSPSPLKKRYRGASAPSGVPPQSAQKRYIELSPQQIAEAVSRKKESLRKVLQQARYPTDVAEQLLEKTIFTPPDRIDRRHGNIVMKFFMRLPSGSSISNNDGILLNPYSLGGGGFFGGGYDLQGSRYRQKKQVQREETPDDSKTSILSSSSDEEEDGEQEEEGVKEQEESYEVDPIYLLTTEEEDYVDEEGEDEYSSLED